MQRPDFYRQEHGLLLPPNGIGRNRISWNLENVMEGFKEFYRLHSRWPLAQDMDSCDYLPTVKTLERKFGGITKIRELLGLSDTDYRKGTIRSATSSAIGKRGFELEEEIYHYLVSLFHEPFVHYQSRIALGSYGNSIRVDMLIYHQAGKFAVDVFHPDKDKHRFSNNVAMKIKVYKKFPFKIFLVVGNQDINPKMIVENQISAKNGRNSNIVLLTKEEFIHELGDYQPLPDPYRV